jgi:lysyl-tRNA synthetase class I
MGEKGKIPEEACEDILIRRAQGDTWATIAKFLKKDYQVEVTVQAISAWYKKRKNENKAISIREEYSKDKGEDEVKKEMLETVENMNKIIKVGMDMLNTIEETPKEKKIMWHNAFKNIVGGIISASKTKIEMLTPIDGENDKDMPKFSF